MVRERGFWLMMLGLLMLVEPMIRPGLPPTEDGVIHAYRVLEMDRLWRVGVFYSRWAPDLAFGLGTPLFHFLGPLFPWLGALGRWIGLPLELSIKIPLAGLLLLGSAGVYGLARLWGLSEPASLIAGLAFASAPFRVRELYGQGDYPQYLATSLLPWALFALHRVLRGGRGGWRFAAAWTIAWLPLSHNISALLSVPILLGYSLLVIGVEGMSWRRILRILHVLAIGAGLAAFFVLPALADRSLVHLDRLLQGEYDFRKHFVDLGTLLSMPPLRDDRLGNRRLILTLGLHQVLLSLPAWWGLVRSDQRRGLTLGCAGGLAGMIAMMLPVSRPVWEAIPLLAYAEFPWRWLGIAALPLALLVGLAVDAMPPRWRGGAALLFSMLLIAGSLGLLYNGGTPVRLIRPTLADLHAYERRHRYPGLTSVGELFPRWVQGEIEGSSLEAAYLEGREPIRLDRSSLPPGADVRVLHLGALDQRYQVALPVGVDLRFEVLAFPGWTVRVDGRPAVTWAEAGTGRLRAEIPPGSHEIRLRFEPLLHWRLLELFSAGFAALGIWRWVFPPGGRILRRIPSILRRAMALPASAGAGWRSWSVGQRAMAALFIVSLISQAPYRLWNATRAPLDRPPGPAAYVQADYGSQIRLVGYRLEPSHVPPGGEARLILWWRPLRFMETQYSVYVHAYPASGEPRLAFQSDHMHPADVPTNAWDVERIYMDGHLLRVPSEIPPGLYRIRVGLYERLHPESRLRIDGSGEDGFDLPTPLVVARPIPMLPQPISFGGKIRLVGVELPSRLAPGAPWTLWLAFEAVSPMEADYTLFVHVVDEKGVQKSQRDLWQPTSRWPGGVSIPIAVELDGLPHPGRYFLRIGWYKWPEMIHLAPEFMAAPFYLYPVPIEVR